ncbi:glycoside hydrolase family 2 TIM barrel-domain containing protein [Arthrobacter sp. D2-10]
MIRAPFNDNWTFAPKVSIFEDLRGGEDRTTVTLPHDAMLSGGRGPGAAGGAHTGYFHSGAWQYEKTLDVPAAWGNRRVALEFEGVYRDAMVYINGELAAQWANGYSVFHVAMDPFLRYGESNSVRVEAQANEDSRWYSGAGIHRPVHLLLGGLVHIPPTGFKVTTPQVEPGLAAATTVTEIVNADTSTSKVRAFLTIHDPAGAVVATDEATVTVRAGESVVLRQKAFLQSPSLWEPNSPHLYTAAVSLSDEMGQCDEASVRFGIRSVTVDPYHGLRINGRGLKLRGACIHHDNGILGSSGFKAAEERRVRRLKEAGFNAIRSAHNPMSVAMLDACDEQGMLVMDEAFDVWTQSKTNDDYSRRFSQWWEKDIDALVAKDFNHPSVILYSTGNEIPELGTPHGARWGRLLAERIRSQDSTRPITNGINGSMLVADKLEEIAAETEDDSIEFGGGFNAVLGLDSMMNAAMRLPEVGKRMAEPASVLDVVGLNYGDVRYTMDRDAFPNRVIVGAETFPTQIDKLWKLVSDNQHVIGDFTWTGWDYLGEAGIGRPRYAGDTALSAEYPWLTAGCGDIDLIGERRPISYYREIVFGLRDQPFLSIQRPEHRDSPAVATAWSWTDSAASWTWDLALGTPVVVEAYANAEEVAFVLNGVEVTRSRVGVDRSFLATAEIPYERGTLEAVALVREQEVGRCQLVTASDPVRVELSVEQGASDLVFVGIAVVDGEGRTNPLSEVPVTVDVTGPARLQALGSARPNADGEFLSSSCVTYEGRALAAVRPNGSGTVGVRAHISGLQPHEISYTV